jgi:hypothetical protein
VQVGAREEQEREIRMQRMSEKARGIGSSDQTPRTREKITRHNAQRMRQWVRVSACENKVREIELWEAE